MDNGWIKLHNKFLKWEWLDTPEMVSLWIYLLLKANWQDGRWHGQIIGRGQLVTGLYRLNEETGISIQKLRTCLQRLEDTEQISVKSTNKYRIITIIKYSDYQQFNKQLTNKQQTTNKQLTTIEKYKTNKTNKTINIKPSLEDVKNYCLERKNQVDPETFVNFYEAKGWMIGKNKVKDWKACVRTWEKREIKRSDGGERILHDGTKAINKFGVWVDAKNPMVKIDLQYYPELK